MSSINDSIRKELTASFVESIKEGVIPWRASWSGSVLRHPRNAHNNQKYSGINTLILIVTALQRGYAVNNWSTANAMTKEVGAHVRKGEKGTQIVYFNMIPKKDKTTKQVETDSKGNAICFPMMKSFYVFNVHQFQAPDVKTLLTGKGRGCLVGALLGGDRSDQRKNVATLDELKEIAAKYAPGHTIPIGATREDVAEIIHRGIDDKIKKMTFAESKVISGKEQNALAEKILENSKAVINYGYSKAAYNLSQDCIVMPNRRQFESLESFYQVMFHEMAHWTMPTNRVGREGAITGNDEEKYAFEELVAELSSCFTLIELGIKLDDSLLPQSASYLSSWLTKLEDNPKYLFSASTIASKVSDYLLAFSGLGNNNSDKDFVGDKMELDEFEKAA